MSSVTSASNPQARAGALTVEWLGRVPYARALALQEEAREARTRGETGDRLLLLEHPPVVTLGRGSHEQNLLLPRAEYAARGIEVFDAARGGDVTLHAPGQLVGYLVVDLDARGARDLHGHVRRIEGALMAALARFDVPTRRIEGRSGVFVDREHDLVRDVAGLDREHDLHRDVADVDREQALDRDRAGLDRKLASIGVGVKRWVTWHGFALNVTTDLSLFDVLVPCGLGDVEMTSVAQETGRPALGLDAQVREVVTRAFKAAFDDVAST